MKHKINILLLLTLETMLLNSCVIETPPSDSELSSEASQQSESSHKEEISSEVESLEVLESSEISSSTPSTPLKLIIENNGEEVSNVDIDVNEEISLNAFLTQDKESTFTWKSSNENIATVSKDGTIKGVSDGVAIITVTSNEYVFLSTSIFVTVATPVGQIGVGSGHTMNDPIYIGNEGKNEPLEIYFIEMQHIYADSLFIKKGNVEILIDSGYEYDGQFVKEFVSDHLSDGRLDLLIATHSDGDHIDGFTKSIDAIDDVSLMIDYGGVGGGGVKKARDKFIPKGTQYHSALDCVSYTNGATDRYYLTPEFYFDVLDTGSYIANTASSASNPASVAVIFYYKDFKFFTAGDITSATEANLLKREDLPEVTLYKASHHGSHGSNTQEFMDKLNPKGVAISAARAGQYGKTPGPDSKLNTYNLNAASGHPAATAIERIYKIPNIAANLNVYWNAVNGTMKFTTYGTDSFEFSGSPTNRGYYDLTLTGGTPVWNDTLNCYENKVTGEENLRFHETKAFVFRDYVSYLPAWAQEQYFGK